MPSKVRQIWGRRHVLSDHSLTRKSAELMAVRHRQLGMNAKIVPNGKDKWAVYRSCKLNRIPQNAKPTKKQIHVNQHMIGFNRKNPNNMKPPVTIQTSKGSIRASNIEIEGESKLVYRPLAPLSCGARLWVETDSPVILDDCSRMI